MSIESRVADETLQDLRHAFLDTRVGFSLLERSKHNVLVATALQKFRDRGGLVFLPDYEHRTATPVFRTHHPEWDFSKHQLG